tara:strand:+ start:110 stop:358 length:249 start_codon:yes stop_codon:yes gene_type:complete
MNQAVMDGGAVVRNSGDILFKSKTHVVCLFDKFMTIERALGGGARIDKKHPQFGDWATAFDDIESVSEGDRLCRAFFRDTWG